MFKHDQSSGFQSSRRAFLHTHRRFAPGMPFPPGSQDILSAGSLQSRHGLSGSRGNAASAGVFRELLAAETRIDELERALREARAVALTDPLTGALNRRGFEDAYRQELARARRKGSQFSLVLIDLDDFKKLNDTLGHQVGDQALIHLIRGLRTALRPSDVLCRFGGEEFLVLLPETGRSDAAAAITRFLRRFTSQPLPGTEAVLSFSAGVVVQESGETFEQSLLRADVAAYAAKRAGKNRVVMG
jgi:diguanylate cyclase